MIETYSVYINEALDICYNCHKGKKDKAGVPYIFHPIHIAEQMSSENEIIVALLHDVIEDSDMTLDRLKAIGFSDEVITAIDLLTKPLGMDYIQYIDRLKDNHLARTVKIADIKHNLNLTRYYMIDDAYDARMTKRYIMALRRMGVN